MHDAIYSEVEFFRRKRFDNLNEAEVIVHFVEPLLKLLGYKNNGLACQRYEHFIRGNPRQFADVVLYISGIPKAVIEVKRGNEPLERHESQLKDYYQSINPTPVVAVLTNACRTNIYKTDGGSLQLLFHFTPESISSQTEWARVCDLLSPPALLELSSLEKFCEKWVESSWEQIPMLFQLADHFSRDTPDFALSLKNWLGATNCWEECLLPIFAVPLLSKGTEVGELAAELCLDAYQNASHRMTRVALWQMLRKQLFCGNQLRLSGQVPAPAGRFCATAMTKCQHLRATFFRSITPERGVLETDSQSILAGVDSLGPADEVHRNRYVTQTN